MWVAECSGMSGVEELSREDLVRLVVEQVVELEALAARVASLEEENDRLRAALESRPPSAPPAPPCWVKANRPREGRTKKARKPRGEAFVREREEPTEVVVHFVEECPDCGRSLSGGWVHHRREVIDLPVMRYVVRDHVVLGRYCGVCHKNWVPKLDVSSEVLGQHRMSLRVMAVVAYLRTECRMPLAGVQHLLEGLYGLRISEGEIVGLSHEVAQLGQAEYEGLLSEIRSSGVVHADETGWREDGVNGYVWVFATPTAQLFLRDPSRASRVAREALGDEFDGILVSDFYSGYSPLMSEKQRCWVHLLRDLKALVESHPTSKNVASFVERARGLYDQAKAYREEQLGQAPSESTKVVNPLSRAAGVRARMRAKFEGALTKLARPHLKQAGDPCRVLAERMAKFASELLVFVEHPEVPPDNNRAERSLRAVVVARKVSGGTRSPKGSTTMSILRSLFGSWKLRGSDPLEACQRLVATPAI